MKPPLHPTILFVALALLCAASANSLAQTQPTSHPCTPLEKWEALKWDTSQKGREIDLSKYKRTFNDDFKTMDVVRQDADPSTGTWFSPGHGAFQNNAPLRKDGPFKLVDEGLRLRLEKMPNGRWLGACMQSVNRKGQGFAQKYGYFEMTAKYVYTSGGKGIWGAFWLKSQDDYFDQTKTRTEIDINEFYGDRGYHATVHLWPAAILSPNSTITQHVFKSGFKEKLARDLFTSLMVNGVVDGFHAYGGEVTPQWVIMYCDRKELGRFPTVEEFKTPLYLLVDLVSTKEEGTSPMDMILKNVSAYLPGEPYKE